MKSIVPTPPAVVRNDQQAVQSLFHKFVVPSYGRFDLAFTRGSGSHVWDVCGRRYLDMGGGIAVNALGHAHPELTEALIEQSRRLTHVSNLYYHEPQGRLAEAIVSRLAPGKVFFANSGAEANEGLYKLARMFGHDEGRFEIITAQNSFHGRTLAGIAATGQEKVKKGFEPAVSGFKHVPYNNLDAVRDALSPATVAVLVECVQGEGGITPASVEYLRGLRALCDERRMLLLFDGVQDGHYRTGRFQAFQRLLEGAGGAAGFRPDALSMAKSLGGGFPIGAFWATEDAHGVKLCDLLGPGTHATTFGGTPLACAVALKVLDVIEREKLADNVRATGEFILGEFNRLVAQHPGVVRSARGVGFLLGLELGADIAAFKGDTKAPSLLMVNRLHEAGLLTIPAGTHVIRMLPALNLCRTEAEEAIGILESEVRNLA